MARTAAIIPLQRFFQQKRTHDEVAVRTDQLHGSDHKAFGMNHEFDSIADQRIRNQGQECSQNHQNQTDAFDVIVYEMNQVFAIDDFLNIFVLFQDPFNFCQCCPDWRNFLLNECQKRQEADYIPANLPDFHPNLSPNLSKLLLCRCILQI